MLPRRLAVRKEVVALPRNHVSHATAWVVDVAVVNALAKAMNPKDEKKAATPAFLASIGIGHA